VMMKDKPTFPGGQASDEGLPTHPAGRSRSDGSATCCVVKIKSSGRFLFKPVGVVGGDTALLLKVVVARRSVYAIGEDSINAVSKISSYENFRSFAFAGAVVVALLCATFSTTSLSQTFLVAGAPWANDSSAA